MMQDRLGIKVVCLFCKQEIEIMVTLEQWNNWKGGMLAQDAFPNLSVDDRELLISKTCGKCFDQMFEGED